MSISRLPKLETSTLLPPAFTININVRPDLNPLIHMHILQRNIRRTNIRPPFFPSLLNPREPAITLTFRRFTGALLMALHVRVPQIVGASAETAELFVFRVAPVAAVDGAEEDEVKQWAQGGKAG